MDEAGPSNAARLATTGEQQQPPVEDTGPLQLYSSKSNLNNEGFCSETGQHWVYPVNYPERKYQLDIVRTALFQNTLVCLPTGLGKTFIAAVVMFNYYRWFPNKKILFLAPTKPLVAQQVSACYNIVGFPKSDMTEMTGSTMLQSKRQEEWNTKKVFFATPQVVANDLVAGICPAKEVCCIVFDEAHKAKGNQSYCVVMQTMRSYNIQFRVLALSATPGSDRESISEVLKNLNISKLKLLTDDSPEVKQYSHKKDIEVIKVSPGRELKEVSGRLLDILSRYLVKLMQKGVVPRSYNISNLSAFQLKTFCDKLNTTPLPGVGAMELNDLRHQGQVAMNLSKAYEMLVSYGKGAFLNHIAQTKAENQNRLLVYTLTHDEDIVGLTKDIKSAQFGHPKMQKLEELLLTHFLEAEDKCIDTKVIIFTEYRQSVVEITEFLSKHSPLIRPVTFVGQSKKGGTGLRQDEQKKVMKDFHKNVFNTLVSTCVGEEGLDIGEVDLIICYDASRSPIRIVQRIGRTGRKRDGKVITILTEGKEYQKYTSSMKQNVTVNKNMCNWNVIPIMNQLNSPRMVPQGVHPELFRKILVTPKETLSPFCKIKPHRKFPTGAETTTLPSAANVFSSMNSTFSKWHEPIPEFSYLDSLKDQSLLALQNYDEMKNHVEEFEERSSNKYDFMLWKEWCSSLQGSSNTLHSQDSRDIVSLMQLADGLNQVDNAPLTQTAVIANEVSADVSFWSTKLGSEVGGKKVGKAQNRPSTTSNHARVTKPLEKKKVKKPKLLPEAPLFPKEEFEDIIPIFQLPKPKEKKRSVHEEIDLFISNLALLCKIRNESVDKDPIMKVLDSVSLISHTVQVEEKPDLDFEPPDISILDHIFADLRKSKKTYNVVVRETEVTVKSPRKTPFVKKLRMPTTPLKKTKINALAENINTIFKDEIVNKPEFNFDLDIMSAPSPASEVAVAENLHPAVENSSQETCLSDELLCALAAELEVGELGQITSTPKASKVKSKPGVKQEDGVVVSAKREENVKPVLERKSIICKEVLPTLKEEDKDSLEALDEDFLEQVDAIEKQQTQFIPTPAKGNNLAAPPGDSDDEPIIIETMTSTISNEPRLSTSKRPLSDTSGNSDFNPRPSKRPKKKKQRNPFALTQASLSGNDSSDEEDCTQMNQYDQSFIDDHPSTLVDIDMHAEYLKSVRSPVIKKGFKIPELLAKHKCVPDLSKATQDTYLEDSFCVVTEGSGSELEEDILEVCEKRLQEKNKKKKSGQCSEDDNRGKKRMRRVIAPLSSDSENEEPTKTEQQKQLTTPNLPSTSMINKPRNSVYNEKSEETRSKMGPPPFPKKSKNEEIQVAKVNPERKTVDSSYRKTLPRMVRDPPPARIDSFPRKSEMDASQTRPVLSNPLEPAVSRNIIVSTNQIQRAPQLVTSLSTKYNLKVIIRTLPPGIDYVISQRLAVSRIRAGDTSSYYPNSKLAEIIKTLNDSFSFHLLIFENDKDCPLPELHEKSISLKSNTLRRTFCQLWDSNTKYLFSKSQGETAEYLAKMCAKESKDEVQRIDDWFEEGEEISARFQFFNNLPHINIVTALKLSRKFASMSDFFESCNSANDVMKHTGLGDHGKANDIYRVLNEPWH